MPMNEKKQIQHSDLKDAIAKLEVSEVTEKKEDFNIYYVKTNNKIVKIKSKLEPKEFYKSLNLKPKNKCK